MTKEHDRGRRLDGGRPGPDQHSEWSAGPEGKVAKDSEQEVYDRMLSLKHRIQNPDHPNYVKIV